MKISKETVLNVARLARLEIDAADVDRLSGQISGILDYVDTLAQVDTTGLVATSHATTLTNAFREDVEEPALDRDTVFFNAPEKDDGAFVVPKVI
ncbi:Asp-tRNA(Asn)/Glu-tRNA(Gln) amidotransferase subunit GatC [Desulfosarcina sp. OttesenSCG-928-G10]|nr:Asp-tRNA(Asn)/Glu-tRNA(Gln) amidotransferase subunit GatC [Desulfosarcina sp. OttesenSCG-928-G10]